ncbi:hypothetical protein H113_08524 [Trichophyton rubrum MR1459]|uniref:LysM domain-containing protein n=2 Tax=Trichophyton rubrum TaxID=5551 RepID=A0A178ET29_TRIRU|nr:uncharacterized protein TERG_01015 [Trichophyton rubrum CBS 118892]EGD84737.1 hypothetical protein TERG_01015 [Trichophyton rubrum CBS 118892]EZF90297.1 hypothetical protein H113_08524 [Trichophyton rubrum MR1459]KMQ41489.1 LysM domain [Trichophyton rubrum]OAL63006.1 hypothetical protein A7C99_5392 [Trichophyton rubrum]
MMVNIQLILGVIILLGTRKAATAALPPHPCAFAATAANGDTCQSLAAERGIGMDQFLKRNPGVNCNALVAGKTYCLSADDSAPGPTASLNPSPKVPTTTLRAVQTMSPKASTGTPAITLVSRSGPIRFMTGMAPDCLFYHPVAPGDTCQSIVDKYKSFTLDQFYAWNPATGRNCESLWLGYYTCVGVKGGPNSPSQQPPSQQPPSQQPPSQQPPSQQPPSQQPPSQQPPSQQPPSQQPPSQQSNTSQQTQPNVNSKCNKWYQVVPGDYCQKIADKFNISLQTFYAWNPSVGSTCASLWAGYNVCVGSA